MEIMLGSTVVRIFLDDHFNEEDYIRINKLTKNGYFRICYPILNRQIMITDHVYIYNSKKGLVLIATTIVTNTREDYKRKFQNAIENIKDDLKNVKRIELIIEALTPPITLRELNATTNAI